MAKLWLLDFDGTLVDSMKAIKACYLKVGKELIPDRCSYIENMNIGPTLDESSRMILTDKNLHLVDEFKRKFQQLYDDKLVLKTTLYPHVDKTIKKLISQGDQLCIVTNKRAYPTHKLINYYGWKNIFKSISCIDEHPKAKNKTQLINNIKIKKNYYSKIFYIGDTVIDGIAANYHNLNFIKAKYGYGKDENWEGIKIYKEIKKFNEILELD